MQLTKSLNLFVASIWNLKFSRAPLLSIEGVSVNPINFGCMLGHRRSSKFSFLVASHIATHLSATMHVICGVSCRLLQWIMEIYSASLVYSSDTRFSKQRHKNITNIFEGATSCTMLKKQPLQLYAVNSIACFCYRSE